MSGYVRDASLRSGIFQTRRGPAASVADLVLQDGEPGYEVDTGRFVVGDGSTRWSSLPSEGHGTASDISVSGLTSLVGSTVQAVLSNVDERLPAVESSSATRAYARAVPGDAAATEANIRAAVAALAAVGGGEILLPEGRTIIGAWQKIVLTAALPVLSGITYRGIRPVTTPNVTAPGSFMDGWDYIGGTVLRGDGTFRGFEGNITDYATPPAGVATNGLSGARILDLGLDNFSDGIRIGGDDNMGLVYGEIDVMVRNCTGWGTYLKNFMLCKRIMVETCLCENGQYYGAIMPTATMNVGNSTIQRAFDTKLGMSYPHRFGRGIVFEVGSAEGTAAFFGATVENIQTNGFAGTLSTDVATCTNGSPNITVPDGTRFGVGMAVAFTTTALGFAKDLLYMVKSVAGNVLTLATSRLAAAIPATGGGALTMTSAGYPNIECIPRNAGASFNGLDLLSVDTEGSTSCGLYLENVGGSEIHVLASPGQCLVAVAARSCVGNHYSLSRGVSTDFDSASAAGIAIGDRTITRQNVLPGFGRDLSVTPNLSFVAVGNSTPSALEGLGDLQQRQGGILYPLAGMAKRVKHLNFSTVLSGNNAGVIAVTTDFGPITLTLATIVSRATMAASHVGEWFEVSNLSAGSGAGGIDNVTVNTDGTQTFNKVVGKTSVSIPPGYTALIQAVEENSSANPYGGTMSWIMRMVVLGDEQPFNPLNAPADALAILGSRLAAWYRADSGTSTTTDGVGVSQWNDQSGNGHHLVQATGSKQPLYKAAIQNGKPVVRFDGVDDFLRLAFTLPQPIEVWVVCKWLAGFAASDFVLSGGAANNLALFRNGAAAVAIAAGTSLGFTNPQDPQNWHVYNGLYNGSTSRVRKDSDADKTGTAGTATPGGITLGASDAASPFSFANVDVAEVIVANVGNLSLTTRAAIGRGLKLSWATP